MSVPPFKEDFLQTIVNVHWNSTICIIVYAYTPFQGGVDIQTMGMYFSPMFPAGYNYTEYPDAQFADPKGVFQTGSGGGTDGGPGLPMSGDYTITKEQLAMPRFSYDVHFRLDPPFQPAFICYIPITGDFKKAIIPVTLNADTAVASEGGYTTWKIGTARIHAGMTGNIGGNSGTDVLMLPAGGKWLSGPIEVTTPDADYQSGSGVQFGPFIDYTVDGKTGLIS